MRMKEARDCEDVRMYGSCLTERSLRHNDKNALWSDSSWASALEQSITPEWLNGIKLCCWNWGNGRLHSRHRSRQCPEGHIGTSWPSIPLSLHDESAGQVESASWQLGLLVPPHQGVPPGGCWASAVVIFFVMELPWLANPHFTGNTVTIDYYQPLSSLSWWTDAVIFYSPGDTQLRYIIKIYLTSITAKS